MSPVGPLEPSQTGFLMTKRPRMASKTASKLCLRPIPESAWKNGKENRTFSRSDHCNDPFPNHKLHIQIIIIWCYHYYSKQLFAKKRECLLKNIPKINEKPIFSVFSETLIPQFVKADKYLDMIFRTSFYTSMID